MYIISLYVIIIIRYAMYVYYYFYYKMSKKMAGGRPSIFVSVHNGRNTIEESSGTSNVRYV